MNTGLRESFFSSLSFGKSFSRNAALRAVTAITTPSIVEGWAPGGENVASPFWRPLGAVEATGFGEGPKEGMCTPIDLRAPSWKPATPTPAIAQASAIHTPAPPDEVQMPARLPIGR